MMRLKSVVLGAGLTTALAACGPSNEVASKSVPANEVSAKTIEMNITKASYDKMSEGMSHKEVVALLGGEGEKTMDMESGGVNTEMYQWVASASDGPRYIIASFSHDKLTVKLQNRLAER